MSIRLRPSAFLACMLPTLLAGCGASALDEEEMRGRDLVACDAGDCDDNGAGGNDSTEPVEVRPCPRTPTAVSRVELSRYSAALIFPMSPVPTATPAAPPLYCGDGFVTPAETCDDFNVLAGDGCDALCRVESGFVCLAPGSACMSVALCGDGVVEGYEDCDDGNQNSGDGCSGDCAFAETGYLCAPGQACEAYCGDFYLAGAETCDDGNSISGDGCSAVCRSEVGFDCPLSASPAIAQRRAAELRVAEPEGPGGGAAPPGPANPAPQDPVDPSCVAAVCGNGIVESGEACDDGNTVADDLCTPLCALAPDCSAGADACQTLCGDGLLLAEGAEACDDGNLTPYDGCDATCVVEATHVCDIVEDVWDASLPPIYAASVGHSECQAVCGDGVVASGEACDDGVNNGLDYGGCTELCTLGQRCGDGFVDAEFGEECDNELNYSVYVADGIGCAPGCKVPPYCGDGITQAAFGEGCDLGVDGNVGDTGGCDATCQAVLPCGDGIIAFGEACDDGNRVPGDGCSDLCQQENTPVPPPVATPAPFPVPVPAVSTPATVDVPPSTPPDDSEEAANDPCR